MDRFEIQYDEHGVQLTNPYIKKIADGVNAYWAKRNSPQNFPELTYGLIHRDRLILERWETILKKEGML